MAHDPGDQRRPAGYVCRTCNSPVDRRAGFCPYCGRQKPTELRGIAGVGANLLGCIFIIFVILILIAVFGRFLGA